MIDAYGLIKDRSLFILIFMVGSEKHMNFENKCAITVKVIHGR